MALLFARRGGMILTTDTQLLVTVIFTTACWLVAAYLGPQTNRQTLIDFYHRVHPIGPGWRRIRIEAQVTEAEAAAYAGKDNVPLALLGWTTGTAAIWSSLFAVGNFLYGRYGYALILTGSFVVSGLILIWVVNRLWTPDRSSLPAGPGGSQHPASHPGLHKSAGRDDQ